jgi:predicted dehydrogenase/threonine dehydrogenase-like Zn-dependent dehydrogenase
MKQLLQDLRTGTVELAEVPRPLVRPGHLLVATGKSLISTGTERMLVEFGKAGWIDKARQQPDKVRQVLRKVRTDGLTPTIEAVRAKLDQPLPLGYCNFGRVLEVGAGVTGFAPGDRVVSNGPHAEVVCVPVNLCAKVPDGVSDSEAAFTVLSAIAVQGIRLAAPTLGETFAVVGLGLIGLITVQLLRANGCRVVGIDIASSREETARLCGASAFVNSSAEDAVAAAMAATGGRGMDGVLITAATRSSEPVSQAAKMCRKRGRIVLVGVSGLELSRGDFFEKELTFQVSCSYGPGRYDPEYEEKGHDYPFGLVRWTEQRNFEAVLELMASGRLDVRPLIGKTVPLEAAPAVYEDLSGEGAGLGILIEYPGICAEGAATVAATHPSLSLPAAPAGKAAVGVAGSGSFATAVLLPAFKEAGARLMTVASAKGVSAARAAKKFGFASATADFDAVLSDPAVNAVVIATRHDAHARMAAAALRAGKHVFVEKPLALDEEQLEEVIRAYEEACGKAPLHLVVGFNRRFAPHVVKMKSLLAGAAEPKAFLMTVNAGTIPASHWTQDPEVGGGRIIGEGCHFVDLLRFLAGSAITDVQARAVGGSPSDGIREDKAVITLAFAGGSIGTIHYLANGHKSFPKERLEVFCGGRILVLDNFRRLSAYGWKGFRSDRLWKQDKGHAAEVAAFVTAVETGGPPPIPFDEIVEVTRATFEIAGHLRGRSPNEPVVRLADRPEND